MKRTLLLVIFVSLFLSACGQGEAATAVAELPTDTAVPTATETHIPTDTPTPVPTDTPQPTATPDPLADYTKFTSSENQLLFQHPQDWMVIDDPASGTVIIISDAQLLAQDTFEEGTMLFMIVNPFGMVDPAPGEFIDGFVGELTGENGVVKDLEPISELETFTVNEQQAGFVEYAATMTETDEPITFFAGAVFGYEHTAFIFGFSPPNTYEEESREVVANLVNSVQLGAEIAEVDTESIYFVGLYDPERDPSQDVADAVALAQDEDKRVLLVVGGDWCITCHLLDNYIASNADIAQGLTDNFVLVKINYSEENENEAFLADYPEIEWFPHFYILENDGTLAESYDTRALETDGLYDDDKFGAFLDQWAPVESESKSGSFYVVKVYDPDRDPFADVETAVSRAQAENKNIILIAGGDWCIWCDYLENFIESNEEVAQTITDNYLIIKVNVSEENENEAFFAQYPEIPGYPHLLVLDQSGEFLHSQGTLELELEETNTYDPEKFIAFLEARAP